MQRLRHTKTSKGFTLIEMLVIAPIVILAIGAFIATIVNLTGEVLSSRGSNSLAYDVQDALNRIEADTKLSTTTLAVNNVSLTTTKQGYVADGTATPGGSTTNFTNIDKTSSSGSPASLILSELVTNGNPLDPTSSVVYLANQPNDCSDPTQYSKNTPMTMNIVYYIAGNTLWRRVIMPSNYASAAIRCGNAPWQQPSCLPGYSVAFCVTNDERLIDGVAPSDFSVQYYSAASSTTPNTVAVDPGTSDAGRNTALLSTPTVGVTITARKTIAGRDIARTGTVRVTRLDTNASAVAQYTPPSSAPSAPVVSSSVSNGHAVTFSWPQVSTATSYELDYQINGGAWTVASNNISNSTRSFTVTQGTHTDTVTARVSATNAAGTSGYGTNSETIPLWAPLLLNGSWSDYGNGYTTAAYTKTKSGIVLIKGLIKNPGSPSNGDIIGTLPSDYVPTGRLMFGTSTASNASARVDVDGSGNVIYSDGGNPGWYSLDTIRYVAASTTGYTRVTPTLANGFSNWGGVYAPASYVQDSTGRVDVQGLLTPGTLTNGTVIFSLPSALQPNLYEHHASRSGTFDHIGVAQASQGGGILAKGDGSGAYSINLMYFPSGAAPWTTLPLVNSWVAYDPTTFATPQYTKETDNLVSLKGLIKGGSATYDTPIATLPAGYRPSQRILYTTVNTAAYARIDIYPNGEVHFMGSNNTWYALDDVIFYGEQ
ncbi:MAG TPA: prepilin-type N-terminal cleavage/methylation domain-containing protein [Dongiaceae bacterium]|nr:prepilin-type N-terminal cleavage/methylation domain-containing protein [Dongiaceae bacterium]